jgi:hypothetical protein
MISHDLLLMQELIMLYVRSSCSGPKHNYLPIFNFKKYFVTLIRGFYSSEFSFLVTNIAANFLSVTDTKMANVMLNLITDVKTLIICKVFYTIVEYRLNFWVQLSQSMRFKQVCWCCCLQGDGWLFSAVVLKV